MRKLLVFVTMVVVLAGASSAFAYSNSGEWMFTVQSPNDSNYDLSALITRINDWFVEKSVQSNGEQYSITSLIEYYKVDEPGFGDSKFMTVTYESDNKSGTWTTQLPVEFYSVKASTEFAFYWNGLDGASSGTWSTENLLNNGGQIPQISHLSAWNPGDTNPVPEPATLLLLGAGLLGLLGFGRKLKK